MLDQRHTSLYASFDLFPSAKGAGTHIARMAHRLFEYSGSGALSVLGDEDYPEYQDESPIEIFRQCTPIPNFLERTTAFSWMVHRIVQKYFHSLRICQFRDPWSGIPVVARRDRQYAAIYEINGLPSIELPFTYARASASTLAKIRALEEECWTEADIVITPSETMKRNLAAIGVPAQKISVVPNGADLLQPTVCPADAPEKYILYFGALQPWQGVDVLLRAFPLLADFEDLKLVICCSHHPRRAKEYLKLAEKLGIAERVVWRHRMSQEELQPWISQALLTVAPLTECSRNLQQGCCPFKVLESMAAGVPVVASDIPAIRELVRDGMDGRIVRPNRPSELARAIRVLLEYPELRARMGESARTRVAENYTWDRSLEILTGIYRLLEGSLQTQPGGMV